MGWGVLARSPSLDLPGWEAATLAADGRDSCAGGQIRRHSVLAIQMPRSGQNRSGVQSSATAANETCSTNTFRWRWLLGRGSRDSRRSA